ncbi:MAG: hypothetical protein U9P90_02105 [Patescibacteria group bacterium]|nr:hypothetical protein [Patescibacteria group bacterium]
MKTQKTKLIYWHSFSKNIIGYKKLRMKRKKKKIKKTELEIKKRYFRRWIIDFWINDSNEFKVIMNVKQINASRAIRKAC